MPLSKADESPAGRREKPGGVPADGDACAPGGLPEAPAPAPAQRQSI